jgi:hypothetical protein
MAAMRRYGLAVAIGLAVGAGLWAAGPAAAEPRAVIELFTSQGCSSCPPADKLIGELATDPSLVAISLPVDYWDYLGWRDTLARPRHTARQRGYASVRGDRKVYTPQVVVNGLAHVLGSDRNAIEAAVGRTGGQPEVMSVRVGLVIENEQLAVEIKPRKEGEAVAEVWLLAIARSVPVAIKSGDNKGKTVAYQNVVRRWVNLGVWTGGEQRWTVPYKEFSSTDVDQVAVIVQAGGPENPSAVLGAGTARLR